MRLFSSRALLHSASRIAIAAAASILAGCSGTSTIADTNTDRALAALEAAEPDAQDYIGGAAYWGARLEANRDDIDAGLNFARNLRLMGGARQAVAVLKDVVMKAPDNARVLSEYGKALTAAGRAKDAVPFLARAVQIKGDDWTTLSAHGVALDQTGNHKAARDNYEAALALSPNNAVVESNMAMSDVLQGKIDHAEITLRRLVARPDATPQMRQNLAMVETLKGNVAEAERLAREDLPPSEAENNIALLRNLDARNAAINVQTLPPPPAEEPKPVSQAPEASKADKSTDLALTAPAPAVETTPTPEPEAPTEKEVEKGTETAAATIAEPVTPKHPIVYSMEPIADEDEMPKAAAPAKSEKANNETAETSTTAKTKTTATPASKPPKATGKPTALRQSYDDTKRRNQVSVANASQ